MQVAKALDGFDEQLADDEACLDALPLLRWTADFVCPEFDGCYPGGAVSSAQRGRGVVNERLLRQPPESSYRSERRAKEDE